MAKYELQRPSLITCAVCFLLGWVAHACLGARSMAALPPPPPPNPNEERGPPTKQELGQAGWTLLHVMAANFPDEPTRRQSSRMEAFLRGLGDFYPCPVCAAHFRSFMLEQPVASESRKNLSLWMCGAHNEVNKRNGKEAFYCDIEVLDARWKDCGCGGNSTTATHRR